MQIEESKIINRRVVKFLRQRFRLDWQGIHGAPHWARVKQNGFLLAKDVQANTRVIEVFAFFHDIEREHDGIDEDHGRRSAKLIEEINEDLLGLEETELDLVKRACYAHSDGQTEEHPVVMACWDADRLDLGRVGYRPDPERLCLPQSKQEDVIQWAFLNSVNGIDYENY